MTVRADDNWFQRRYFAWAEPHYRRFPPAVRAEVERIDRWLYSRRAVPLWLLLSTALVATALGLSAAGLPTPLAIAVGLLLWIAAPASLLAAWLQPERFAGRRGLRVTALATLGAYVGAAVGFVVGRIARYGGLETATLAAAARAGLAESAPWLALATLVFAGMIALTAFARRRIDRAELERARLLAERDAAEREAAEARLRLLEGQIRPHFIFNTLASLQHWVDTGDPRAAPLLRSLTALLRTTLAAMASPLATLDAECAAARHYLGVMQARLGDRLAWTVEVGAGCGETSLPAGLVLALTENAVEHGIEPTLAGGRIEVSAWREEGGAVVLAVRDNGAGLAPGGGESARGVGLANSRARLRHRHGDRATLEVRPRRDGTPGTESLVRIETAP